LNSSCFEIIFMLEKNSPLSLPTTVISYVLTPIRVPPECPCAAVHIHS
jgi:hypothetical protein